ncbi:MAG: Gfo/Idh/MocA family oxidoreductase [Acidimicrobiia bacterium]|nr:Gfo/Idh/MocA family oxidoreductase [Acidimicrobiia bacterium]
MTVRLGLVGLGNWGKRLTNAVAAVDGAELTACFARTATTREAFAAEVGCRAAHSLEDLLETVDGVLIATPHSSHVPLVEAAAASGTHVMCEKPLALDVADGCKAVAAADAAGVLLQVAHYRRRFAPVRRMKAMLDAGEFGTLLHVDGHFSKPFGPDPIRPWRDLPDEAPAGAMTALGVHTVDDLLYLTGPLQRLWALSSNTLPGSDLDDATTALLEFESGVQGTIRTSLRTPTVASVGVYGTAGAARSEEDGHRLFCSFLPDDDWVEHPVEPVDGVVANIAAFVDCIRTGTQPETNGHAGLAVVAVMAAIVESAAAGGAGVTIEV